jgi:predicted RNA-binding protein
MFYFSKVFGSKKSKQNAIQFRDALEKSKEIVERFTFFTTNEWVFDSASIHKLNSFLASTKDEKLISEFEIEITKLQWSQYAMNLGYGIKHYVLKEEASLPSIGYNDVVQRMI